MEAHGVIWVPEIYPGSSSAHRDGKPPGLGRIPRKKGAFLWEQFSVATQLKVQTAFIGMFDELDEGTQILKVVNDPPPQAVGDIGYEGMPSDVYLCWAGKGTKMMRREIPYNATKPDCPSLTQPTIPTAFPFDEGGTHIIGSTRTQDSANVTNLNAQPLSQFTLRWMPALALEGGGAISHYQVVVDGVVRRTEDASTTAVTVAIATAVDSEGHAQNEQGQQYQWRVRAINTLGNAGGWSLPQSFGGLP
jgi:hypothetical protein